MCCRADTNINSLRLAPSWINISWSALQQHVLISDNSEVRKNYFLITVKWFIALKGVTKEYNNTYKKNVLNKLCHFENSKNRNYSEYIQMRWLIMSRLNRDLHHSVLWACSCIINLKFHGYVLQLWVMNESLSYEIAVIQRITSVIKIIRLLMYCISSVIRQSLFLPKQS